MNFSVIIPARYQSQRLPGKPLIDLRGKPMVQRVYEQAALSDATRVIVATDDERIQSAVKSFGGEACMTREDHKSGTDRLQEVCILEKFAEDHVVVNVQGDEPLMPPSVINQVANNLVQSGSEMATLSEDIDHIDDLLDPNIVKVTTNSNSMALYFSRAPIPWARDEFSRENEILPPGVRYQRHLGIYAYRVSLINRYVGWDQAILEQAEKLEQLRVLWHGVQIHVDRAVESIPPGIDTQKDLRRTLALLEEQAKID